MIFDKLWGQALGTGIVLMYPCSALIMWMGFCVDFAMTRRQWNLTQWETVILSRCIVGSSCVTALLTTLGILQSF